MIYPWQQTHWQQIQQLLKTERLPHALLLHGNQGLGKKDFAVAIANALLCKQPGADLQACGQCKTCQLLSVNTHPDLYYFEPTPPPKSTSKNPVLSIKIDVIRSVCEKMNQTSQYGGYRVTIINHAEQMNTAAANSLLKTLEEPGQNVLIILLTSRPHRLPATIRSRCQTLRFSEPDDAQALDWIKQKETTQGLSPAQLQQALRQAHGSPLAALQQLDQAEFYQTLSEAMTAGISGKNSLEYAAKLVKFSKIQTLEGMLSWASDLTRILTCGPDTAITNELYRLKLQALAKKVQPQRLFRFYDQVNFNILHSPIALNEQLLWENLLLSWDNL